PVETVLSALELTSGRDAKGTIELPAFTTSGPGESWDLSFAVVWTGAAADDTFTLTLPKGGTQLRLTRNCPADWDGDGKLGVPDFLSFLADYAQAAPSADFDGNGALNVLDLTAFIQSYAAGCE